MVCPHNIVAGAATVGVPGREGEALRLTITPCLVYALAGGAIIFAIVR
jgi:lactate permease